MSPIGARKNMIGNKGGGVELLIYSLVQHVKVNCMDYVLLALIAASIHVFVMITVVHVDPSMRNDGNLITLFHYGMNKCVKRSDNKILQDINFFAKGENYVPGFNQKENEELRRTCIITRWNAFHFLSHFILVLIFPRCWVTIFIVSLLYEIWEYVTFKGHDIGDIFYNSMGVGLALLIRRVFMKSH